MENVTRRLFLRRAAVAAPLALVPAGAAIAAGIKESGATLTAAPIRADGEIFRLAREYRRARKAYEHLEKEAVEARRRFEAAKPRQPFGEPYTAEECAERDAMSVADLLEGRWGPLLTAHRERSEAWKVQATKAWNAEVEAFRRSSGYEEAQAASGHAYRVMSGIAEKLYATRAHTVNGMLVKARIQAKDDYDAWLFEREIIKDLRALKTSGAVLARRAEA
ncbi:hypothetical protein [Antarcticirhabdus aurantiaca]|uniref:Uncharacterized protein n=1 Tax=Antarcticirhabdus aurantiaca TaxID=2606717 RepID=A0ACD4NPX3_9HYPH|nr:hypothetical protein [Antarcticirhabdus aurantiaca]WAJ28920.1 hypothetical protein OXU80_01305 [Jeongeuplla avenae]